MDKEELTIVYKAAEVVAKKQKLKQEDKEDLIQKVCIKFQTAFDPQRGSAKAFINAVAITEAKMLNRSFYDRREDLRGDPYYFEEAYSKNNSFYTQDHEMLELNSERHAKLKRVQKYLTAQQKKLLLDLCRGKTTKELRKQFPGRKFYSSLEQAKLKMKRFTA